MAIWNVLTKELSGETETRRAERVVFVREKFSVTALFFAPLVLLWHRLWLAFAGYVVLLVALGLLDRFAELPGSVETASVIGLNVLVALELPTLRMWKLCRTGYLDAGVVVANTRDEAERRFFAVYEPMPVSYIQRPQPARATSMGVIGTFQEVRPS